MKFLARTWLAAAVTLVLVATVAAAPRPEVSIEPVAPVDREVDGGRTTQAIWYVMGTEEEVERKDLSAGVALLSHLRMRIVTPNTSGAGKREC